MNAKELLFTLGVLAAVITFNVVQSLEGLIAIMAIFTLITWLAPQLRALRWPSTLVLVVYGSYFFTRKIPYLNSWPLDLALPTLIGALVASLVAGVDLRAKWRPKISGREWLSLLLILVISVTCLIPYFFHHRGEAQSWPVPNLPKWALPFVVIGVALVNGLREEIVYRWLLQRTFLKSLSPAVALFTQAVAFGFMHFQHGFPRGWVGVGLTTVFGLMMGLQFRWSKSMALAWITHATVDAVMFCVILAARPVL